MARTYVFLLGLLCLYLWKPKLHRRLHVFKLSISVILVINQLNAQNLVL